MSGIGDARVRFTLATAAIRAKNTVGTGERDEEIAKRNGYADMGEYWADALAHEMDVPDFVRLIETHLLDPARTADQIFGRALPLERFILKALREAFKNNETWVFQARDGGNKLEDMRLRPREAVVWLMRRPFDRDKAPQTLRAFLQQAETDNTAPRSRAGAKPKADWDVVREALKIRIKEIGPHGPDHDDVKWRSRADVIRWVDELLIARDEIVAHSTVAERVDKILANIN
jgi:hypothetical protein